MNHWLQPNIPQLKWFMNWVSVRVVMHHTLYAGSQIHTLNTRLRYTDHLRDTLIIFSGLQVNIMVSCDTETAENTETAWLECKSLLLSSDKSHIFSNTTRLNREQWGFAWSHMSLHFPFPHWSSSQYWSTASYEYWWPVSPEKNTPVISRFRRDLLRFNLNMNLFHPWLSLSCSTFILSL